MWIGDIQIESTFIENIQYLKLRLIIHFSSEESHFRLVFTHTLVKYFGMISQKTMSAARSAPLALHGFLGKVSTPQSALGWVEDWVPAPPQLRGAACIPSTSVWASKIAGRFDSYFFCHEFPEDARS